MATKGQFPGGFPIVFFCRSCGMRLSVDASKAGTSGPCPGCGAWLTSPAENPGARASKPAEHAPAVERDWRKTRVIPDANVDRAHLEWREFVRMLLFLALVVLVLSLCVGVAWFLKNWQQA